LKKIGVSAMRPEGEPFDPNFHEAMLREPTKEYEEGTVMEQLVRGYLLNNEVLRYAMVKVAAVSEDSETEEVNGNTSENS
jgi:molecular chaperone GrpE